MVLFDTNVLIDYWHQPKELLKLNITPENFALCGIVRTELLHGAKDDEVDKLLTFFKSFKNLINDDYDWEGTGFILQTLRSKGLNVPLSDALIAFTAMKYDIPLWTRDNLFKFIQGYFPELKLYKE